MKLYKLYISVISILSLLAIYSCDSGRLYEKNKKIENYTWKIESQAKFDVDIEDTLTLYKFYINLRHTGDYKYKNLYLFLNTIYPNNRIALDTIELQLTNDKDEWIGEGLSNIKYIRKSIKKGIRFPQKGVYSFIIEHGMRDNPLNGISDIGIRIEKQ